MILNKKKTLFAILLANLFIFAVGIAYILHGHQDDITLYDIPLYDASGIYNDGSMDSEGNNVFSTQFPVSRYCFIGKTEPLQSGIILSTAAPKWTAIHTLHSMPNPIL